MKGLWFLILKTKTYSSNYFKAKLVTPMGQIITFAMIFDQTPFGDYHYQVHEPKFPTP